MFVFDSSSERISEIDLYKGRLEALLSEYSNLRTEVQNNHSHHIQLITVMFSALTALVGAASALKNIEIVASIAFIILPCLIMLMGISWIDSIYRRVRSTRYTKILEGKLNRLLQCNNLFEEPMMDWEHWIERKEDRGEKSTKNRTFRTWIVAIGWLIFPFLGILIFFLLTSTLIPKSFSEFLDIFRTYCPVSVLMIPCYGIYVMFFYGYRGAIKNFFPKESR